MQPRFIWYWQWLHIFFYIQASDSTALSASRGYLVGKEAKGLRGICSNEYSERYTEPTRFTFTSHYETNTEIGSTY